MDVTGLVISLLPLVIVFLGIVLFKKSGSVMVIVAMVLTAFLAWGYFHTGLDIIYGGIVMGILKSLGIGLTVVFAMFLVFLMQITGALSRISEAVHQLAGTKEEKALFVGMGFGSFVTALGLVTPALFPPLLVAMGFTPLAAIAIACLGYDPLCSFALLSLPISLPASAAAGMGIPVTEHSFAMNISIFLPVISVLFAFAILFVVGGTAAIKRSWVPALLSGLVISLTALVLVYTEIVPLSIVGVIAGSASMVSLYLYHKAALALKQKKEASQPKAAADGGEKVSGMPLLKALSPWILLIALVGVVSIPQIAGILKGAPGNLEVLTAFANQKVDLDVLSQAYTWILVASVLGIFTLDASKAQVSQALDLTAKRFFSPFLTYTLFFCIAYVMYYSGGSVAAGKFVPTSALEANMDGIIGVALAAAFGAYYGLVAPIPGFIGCVIGGSETSSNVMFAKIQNVAVTNTIGADKFALAFGSLAVAGGIASAITPSKIHNACVTLGEGGKMESEVLKVNAGVAVVLTLVTCAMTFLFLKIGLGF